MADILMLGCTHFPRLRLPDEQWNLLLLKMLADPEVPDHMKDPASWPQAMREEWGEDRGLTAAGQQRIALTEDFRRIREELDRFDPDFILIWGDDQCENFQADAVPAFSVLAYDGIDVAASKLQPVRNADAKSAAVLSVAAVLDEDRVRLPIDRAAGKMVASALIERGFDMAYAYEPRHIDLGHAFLNTMLYLGADETGFPWKVVPVAVNCYGRIVIAQRGMPRGLSEAPISDFDPPSPSAARCFDLGAATARFLKDSPYRVALTASSSWSHAFMTRKNYLLYPDMDADKALYDDLVAGNYQAWRNRSLAAIEDSGQQEILNWMCLAGAMNELGVVTRYARFHESYIFNSPKVFLIAGGAEPAADAPAEKAPTTG